MRLLIYIVICFFLIQNVNSQENNDLTKNANAIIEHYDVELKVVNSDKAVLKVSYKCKILNKNGYRHAVFSEYYDVFRKIKSFDGKIYNALNIETTKLKFKDINDKSLINNFSLYEDNRIKYYQPLIKKYPYYVEYNYEIEYDGILSLPGWQPLTSHHLAVKNATFKVISRKTNSIRFKTIEIGKPEIISDEINESYSWEIDSIFARAREPYSLSYSLTSPTVYIAPNEFEMDGISGIMTTWEDFGKWRYTLISTQTSLPGDAINDAIEIGKESTDKRVVAKKIYEYMQSRTRYVSIQEGIGGWQPMDATTVHNLGYGDCKALSNYTKALLDVVGIKSHYAVVRAGVRRPEMMTDFPSNQFNHVILCLPFEADTVWLECTSQKAPFGYLGDFTANKQALLITEEGGKIANTTSYDVDVNTQFRNVDVEIQETGDAEVAYVTRYSGLQYDNISYLINKSKKDQEEYILEETDINNFIIKNFSFSDKREIIPTAIDSVSLDVSKYANKSGERLFFKLNVLNRNSYIPVKLENRISPIRFTYPYNDVDSITFNIPSGYAVEYLPENSTIENEFGNYSISFEKSDNEIKVVRQVQMNKGVFSSELYPELIKFFKHMEKQDKVKCVLKKE